MKISAIIPARNEAENIGIVLDAVDRKLVTEIVVADNASTDNTAETAGRHGAHVVYESRKGYGYACLAALDKVSDPDVVVFLDGDLSDDPSQMKKLLEPIMANQADFVVGSRTLGKSERGALTLTQRYGNWLAAFLLSRTFGITFTDLGPFRAIRYNILRKMAMRDKRFGWTVEMQIKAAMMGIRYAEVPVDYRRRRHGKSKVSGTIKGVTMASLSILFYLARAVIGKWTGRYCQIPAERSLS
ncbi:MAG: glycosyltransferase [Chitinivibrionales bacterium]|nr:glycosyltransferase [Chitinivibrionales bacterium]MBD3355515.1 glycosyltransferase [Chitinivibrionales bacterium]